MKHTILLTYTLASVVMLSASLIASETTGQIRSTDNQIATQVDDHTIAPEEGAPDYVALVKEALRQDETCAPYVDAISVTLAEDVVTLAGEVDTLAIRYRIAEVARNTTYFEIINELVVKTETENADVEAPSDGEETNERPD